MSAYYILSQKTNFSYEVIVCDDASPDNTFDVIQHLGSAYSNLVILRNEVNLGLVATMHRLLNTATGEFIAYLDGDDIALPGKLQQQVDYLDANSQCTLVYHESEVFDSNSGAVLKYFSQDYYNYQHIPQQRACCAVS
ncbi:glycosyltransferase [Arsukibacterium sp. MJ3]|uniref:glycosyltransferase family 2 protein n=1 Tax=Arsukibacterium sp. MJ3 TaxID=1632859 RepID=UPI00069A8F50|nr:glycosyltransferase [Arsukibacterium sp. MJ3]